MASATVGCRDRTASVRFSCADTDSGTKSRTDATMTTEHLVAALSALRIITDHTRRVMCMLTGPAQEILRLGPHTYVEIHVASTRVVLVVVIPRSGIRIRRRFVQEIHRTEGDVTTGKPPVRRRQRLPGFTARISVKDPSIANHVRVWTQKILVVLVSTDISASEIRGEWPSRPR